VWLIELVCVCFEFSFFFACWDIVYVRCFLGSCVWVIVDVCGRYRFILIFECFFYLFFFFFLCDECTCWFECIGHSVGVILRFFFFLLVGILCM